MADGCGDLLNGELMAGARLVVEKCCAAKPDEPILVIGDTRQSTRLFQSFFYAAMAIGARPSMLIYPAGRIAGEEPTPVVSGAMKGATLIFAITTKSLTHTTGTREAREAGARILVMPGVSEEIFLRNVMVDYDLLRDRMWKMHALFDAATVAEVTSPAGTNIKAHLGFKTPAPMDGFCVEPGEVDQSPGGALGRGTIEGSVEGVLVLEPGRAGMVGVYSERIEITVKRGKIDEVRGGKEAEQLRSYIAQFGDPNLFQVCEVGSGANPNSILSGSPIEDERVIGSIHFGLGDNSRYFGGTIKAKGHLDISVLGHTLRLDGKEIVKDGKLLF